MEQMRMSDRMRDRWVSHHIRQRLVGVLGIFEDMIYVLLAFSLFAGALYIIVDTVVHLDLTSLSSFINSVLDRFLIVLMLAELLHTLLLFLKTHQFRHQPFLIVGIIAAIRRILVITAKAAVNRPEVHVSSYLLDLGVTTFVALALTLALRWSPKQDEF
ncbi:phosphate-starvation-inducible PsiE family protein [Sulfobacillus harzensis]|uniref:Phosphate-starvation-inducible E-like protein n=1 Tax=Sulfobacillus harzensis TaxID=2729629 RepID=A0A7Y0L364_9FIRM|nr:phosphate-starvation-inducible PsiE family protein [Sulfobacillus harzensis]NMP21881.1 hypothetical protein [Sulfobacillus harzensis]